MSLLQADDFRPHLGSGFALASAADGRMELCLAELKTFDTSATEGFSLLFRGPRRLLPQGIHRLEHPALGALEIFLVPVLDPAPDTYTYEAVFNRMKPRVAASPGGA